MPTPSKQEYVYLIGSRKFGWYKIGKAKNPAVRVVQLGILLPFKVMVFGLWATSRGLLTEGMMHEKYADYAVNGEWFAIPLEDVVRLLRESQPYDSSLVYSIFDPETYTNADKIGVRADFSNIENDNPPVSKGLGGAKGKLKREHAYQWLENNGLEACGDNWRLNGKAIYDDFVAKYGGKSDQNFAFAGKYVV